MSRTEIEAKSLDFTLATCGAEVCFRPFSTVVASRRFGRYRGKNGHQVGVPKTTFLTQTGVSPPSIDTLRKVYSITSSASATRFGGTVRPRFFAVLRLMTNSNLVGCSTGRSAGLAPCRILLTKSAACRKESEMFGP